MKCSQPTGMYWFYVIKIRVVASGGPVVPGPPFEIGAPSFHVWLTGCCIHPTLYFKNVPLQLVFGPLCC